MAEVQTLPNARQERTEETIVPVSRLKPAPWNPKVITAEKRAALKAELVEQGPERTAPMDIVPEGLLQSPPVMNLPDAPDYVVADGNMRLDIISKDLHWQGVRAIIHYDWTLEDAMFHTYAREYGRGEIDPFKEGEFFKTLVEQGKLTLKQLSERLATQGINLDISTLSRKISIAKMEPEVKKKASGESALPTSALEVVATVAEPELQNKVLDKVEEEGKKLEKGDKVTVRRVEQIVKETKQEDVARKAFDELLAKATFKKCPSDKSDPVFDPTHNYATDPKPLFRCNSVTEWWEHKWNPMTGEQPNMPKHTETEVPGPAADKPEKPPTPPPFPDFIRTTHSADEVRFASAAMLKDFVGGIDTVEEVRLTAKMADGRDATFFLNREYVSGDVTVETKGGSIPAVLFRVEPKKYKEDALKEYRATVRAGGTIKNSAQAAKVDEEFEAFLKKWLPPGKAEPLPTPKSKDKPKGKEGTLDGGAKGSEKSKKKEKGKKAK